MNNNLLDITIQQLSRLAPEKTLLILHPANLQQHRLVMTHLLGKNVCYIQLTPEAATLPDFLKALKTAVQEQTDITLKTTAKSAQPYAEALTGLTLIFDGYDIVQDPAIDQFIITLAGAIQTGRVVISTRQLPTGILFDHPNNYTAIIPSAPEHLLVDYAAPANEQSILEVRALGAGQAFINGRPLEQWDGVLPKCLFYFLVDRAMATRTDIFETFWPALEKREATNVFHVTKRKVSEILGQDLTTYASSFYRIADKIQLFYDVVLFQEAVQNAEVADSDDEAIPLYLEAIRLYKGPFLSTLDQEWITERREELQLVYTEALTGLAHIYRRQKRTHEALGLYTRAFANMPHREDLARILMEIYDELGRPADALAIYDQLSKVLRSGLKLEPSPEVAKLAETIRKKA